MTKPIIYFLRHGETVWNAERRLQGHRDSQLTERGYLQAERCSELLKGLLAQTKRSLSEFDLIASPLGRARATMERVLRPFGDGESYRLESRLMEMSYGAWEGLTFEEVRARDPHVLARRDADPWGFVPPGGESYAALTARVADWRASVLRDTIVVAHGGTGRALMAQASQESRRALATAPVEQGVVYLFAGEGMICHR